MWKAEIHTGHVKLTHDNIEWVMTLHEHLLIQFLRSAVFWWTACIFVNANMVTALPQVSFWIWFCINPVEKSALLFRNPHTMKTSTFLSLGAFRGRKCSQIVGLGVYNLSIQCLVFYLLWHTTWACIAHRNAHASICIVHLLYRKVLIIIHKKILWTWF